MVKRGLNDQKHSINLISLVTLDQISAFPIQTPQKLRSAYLVFVVQHDQEEDRYILFRGTEPRVNATTINGDEPARPYAYACPSNKFRSI